MRKFFTSMTPKKFLLLAALFTGLAFASIYFGG